MIAYTVFMMIGVVGMGGTEQTAHILVVLRVLIGVAHDKPDGTARRFALKDTAQQFHLIGFLTRRGDLALSRTTTVEFTLDERYIDIDTSGHPVDDASDGFSVALAKRGQPKYGSERIHRVGVNDSVRSRSPLRDDARGRIRRHNPHSRHHDGARNRCIRQSDA